MKQYSYYASGIALVAAIILSGLASARADTEGAPNALTAQPPAWLVYIVIILVIGGAIVSILLIRQAAAKSKWSLVDALSEEVTITAMTTDAAGIEQPLLNPAGAPVSVTELRASSSRLIALMGLMAILLMFLGFGSFALYRFAAEGQMPQGINDVVKFLVAGLTMFAPYVVNKFASIFESLSPKS